MWTTVLVIANLQLLGAYSKQVVLVETLERLKTLLVQVL